MPETPCATCGGWSLIYEIHGGQPFPVPCSDCSHPSAWHYDQRTEDEEEADRMEARMEQGWPW